MHVTSASGNASVLFFSKTLVDKAKGAWCEKSNRGRVCWAIIDIYIGPTQENFLYKCIKMQVRFVREKGLRE